MDPVTAFQVAGSIVTFFDLGCKFVHQAWAIYYSNNSEPVSETKELAQLTQAFEQAVKNDLQLDSVAGLGPIPDPLAQLRLDSIDFSRKLVERLRAAGLIGIQQHSRRSAVKAAYHNLFKADVLEQERERLLSLQSSLTVQLLVALRAFALKSQEFQKRTLDILQISAANQGEIKTNMQIVLDHVLAKAPQAQDIYPVDDLRKNLLQRIIEEDCGSASEDISYTLVTGTAEKRNTSVILQYLSYDGINQREEVVAKTFPSTFDWIFQDSSHESQKWDSFADWCRSTKQIYWISGKPGSGKSTLMKYLSQPPQGKDVLADDSGSRAYQHLKVWAGRRQLLIIPFYFWAAGAQPIQVSQEGLLRTLLWQSLKAVPMLIPTVFPAYWEGLAFVGANTTPTRWIESSLQDYLKRMVAALQRIEMSVCFFVDGLDEFDGNPEDLLDLVEELAAQGNHIKICVASRPWVNFQDRFKLIPRLRLEDFTHDDIQFFVSKKLQGHPEFAGLQVRAPSFAEQIVENIVEKSCGVFLWVDIVVSSLIAGLYNGDRVQDLQKKLDELPPELDDLYSRLLQGLDEIYHEHRAQMILLVEAAGGHLSLEIFPFADELDLQSYTKRKFDPFSQLQSAKHLEAANRRLSSRWRGLLEVQRSNVQGSIDAQSKVYYLHKTVRDWIQGSKMQRFLRDSLKTPYDANLQLCIGACATLKAHHHNWKDHHITSSIAVYFADRAGCASGTDAIEALDHLLGPKDNANVYAKRLECLLNACVDTRSLSYLKAVLTRGIPQEWVDALLLYIIRSTISLNSFYRYLESVELLLSHGASVEPSWTYFCQEMADVLLLRHKLEDFIRVFLRYGADIRIFRMRISVVLDKYARKEIRTWLDDLEKQKCLPKSPLFSRFKKPKMYGPNCWTEEKIQFRPEALAEYRQLQGGRRRSRSTWLLPAISFPVRRTLHTHNSPRMEEVTVTEAIPSRSQEQNGDSPEFSDSQDTFLTRPSSSANS